MAEQKIDNSNIVLGDSGQATSDKNLQPIVNGASVIHKKSLGAKLRETFIGEDVGNIGNYVVWQVIVPSIRNALLSTMHGVTDMLFGGGKSKPGTGGYYGSYYGYQPGAAPWYGYAQPRYGYQPQPAAPQQPQPPAVPQARNSRDVGQILFKTRSDAEMVAGVLRDDILGGYGCACVRDLYELVGGVEIQATDNAWGWRDLSSMTIRPVANGYLLEMPVPIYLN